MVCRLSSSEYCHVLSNIAMHNCNKPEHSCPPAPLLHKSARQTEYTRQHPCKASLYIFLFCLLLVSYKDTYCARH